MRSGTFPAQVEGSWSSEEKSFWDTTTTVRSSTNIHRSLSARCEQSGTSSPQGGRPGRDMLQTPGPVPGQLGAARGGCWPAAQAPEQHRDALKRVPAKCSQSRGVRGTAPPDTALAPRHRPRAAEAARVGGSGVGQAPPVTGGIPAEVRRNTDILRSVTFLTYLGKTLFPQRLVPPTKHLPSAHSFDSFE